MVLVPSPASVNKLHDIIIANDKRHMYGITWHGGVQSCLDLPFTTYQGTEIYPAFFTKVAILLKEFCCAHCYVDGNKRIGLLINVLFLMVNGYDYAIPQRAYRYLERIADEQITDIKKIEKWISKRCVRNEFYDMSEETIIESQADIMSRCEEIALDIAKQWK